MQARKNFFTSGWTEWIYHRALQVYRGRLRSTGEEVAVKVQRPGIGDSIALDMVLLRRLMASIDINIPQVHSSCQRAVPGT